MSTFSLNNIIPVTLRVSALPQQAANFSIGLVLSAAQSAKPGAWSSGQRTASYTSAAAITTDFGSDTPLQHFAAEYFGQAPAPTSLKVGLWLSSDTNVTAALTAVLNADPAFYLVANEPGTSDADILASGVFCQAAGLRFFFVTQAINCYAALSSANTNLFGQFGGYSGMSGASACPRACGIYTDAASDANVSGAAFLMSIAATMNIGQPNSMSTFMFKQAALLGKSTLTSGQLQNLVGTFDGVTPGWNGNAYVTMGTTDMLVRGQACDGRFEDEGLALDWLAAGVQTAMFNCIQQAVTAGSRIPQTDEGSARLVTAVESFMVQARSTGLCAPGKWLFDGVGNISTNDVLPKGYYIYAQPVDTMTTSQRAARQAPPISTLVCGAGAIQYCAPTIIFQR